MRMTLIFLRKVFVYRVQRSTRVGSVELFFFRNEFALVYRFGSAR